MSTGPIFAPVFRYLDSNGDPLAGGKVYFYAAGTSTPKDTYSDYDGSVPNTNPVILDARGEANIRGAGLYKIAVYSADDVLIETQDNISATNDSTEIVYTVDEDIEMAVSRLDGIDGVSVLRTKTPVDGATYWLNYHTSEGDGGGGAFRAKDSGVPGTYTDDGWRVIVPTSGDRSTAWVKKSDLWVQQGVVSCVSANGKVRSFDPQEYDYQHECIQAANDWLAANDGGDLHLPTKPNGADYWTLTGTVFFGSIDNTRAIETEIQGLFALPANFVTDKRSLGAQIRVIGHGFAQRTWYDCADVAQLGRELPGWIHSTIDDGSDLFVFLGPSELWNVSIEAYQKNVNCIRLMYATPFRSNANILGTDGCCWVIDSLTYGFDIRSFSTPISATGVVYSFQHNLTGTGTAPGNGTLDIVCDNKAGRIIDDTCGNIFTTRVRGHLEAWKGTGSTTLAGRTEDDGYDCVALISNGSEFIFEDGTRLTVPHATDINPADGIVSIGDTTDLHIGALSYYNTRRAIWLGGGFDDATCDITSGSTTVTCDDTSDLAINMSVEGTGIPTRTLIDSITNSTTFELNKNATATNSNTTLTFTSPFLGSKIFVHPNPNLQTERADAYYLYCVDAPLHTQYWGYSSIPDPASWSSWDYNRGTEAKIRYPHPDNWRGWLWTHTGRSLAAEGTGTVLGGQTTVITIDGVGISTTDHIEVEYGLTSPPGVQDVSIEVGKRVNHTTQTWKIDFKELGTGVADATCDTTNTSTTVTCDDTTDIEAGLRVTGSGIPAATLVDSVTNSTTFELTNAATATATNVTLTFYQGYSFWYRIWRRLRNSDRVEIGQS